MRYKRINNVKQIFKVVEDTLQKIFQALLEKNIAIAWKIIEQKNELHRLNEQLTVEETLGDVHTAVHLSRVMLEIRRIAEFALTLVDDTMFYESTMHCKKIDKK